MAWTWPCSSKQCKHKGTISTPGRRGGDLGVTFQVMTFRESTFEVVTFWGRAGKGLDRGEGGGAFLLLSKLCRHIWWFQPLSWDRYWSWITLTADDLASFQALTSSSALRYWFNPETRAGDLGLVTFGSWHLSIFFLQDEIIDLKV